MIDEVSSRFHHHGHPKDGHGHRQIHDGHAQEHNHHHAEHLDGHTMQNIIDIVPHIGGISIQRLEEAFNSTGLLNQVVAKKAFRAMKEGMEFEFVIGIGRKL
jgi:hypothetical protein